MTHKPRTEKATGILICGHVAGGFGIKPQKSPTIVIPFADSDSLYLVKWPMFARPCPSKPRHGFVDSRPVSGWDEIVHLLQEGAKFDIGGVGEIIVTPVLSGEYSAVVTNNGITWGGGNDGVTSGKDEKTMFIPAGVTPDIWKRTFSQILYYDNLSEEDFFKLCKTNLYIELVEDHGSVRLVQIRNGPEQYIFGSKNHIEKVTTAINILCAARSTDLFYWESQLQNAIGQRNITVVQAHNIPLSSHICVQAIASGFTVITDRTVQSGETFYPSSHGPRSLTDDDYKIIAKEVKHSLLEHTKLESSGRRVDQILTTIATIQAQHSWGNEPHLMHLQGIAVASLLRAVLAGCYGEMRYWWSRNGPQRDDPPLTPPCGLRHTPRDQIYQWGFASRVSPFVAKRYLKAARKGFENINWGRSFGGRPWAEVAERGYLYAEALRRFQKYPSKTAWGSVIGRANLLINTSHNNGKCLTKWVEDHVMTHISDVPTVGFMNAYTAKHVWNWEKK